MIGANQSQSGFVLVSSIWLTLLMLVFAGAFEFYATQKFGQAVESKSRISLRVQQEASEDLLKYVFATSPKDRSGLTMSSGVIKLDGSVYKGYGETLIQVNDYAGLVGLNAVPNYHLSSLVESFENNLFVRQKLLNVLYDYIDFDQNIRLEGREQGFKSSGKIINPANDYLFTVDELKRVHGWKDWMQRYPSFHSDWLSTNYRSQININTAPVELLSRVVRLSKADAINLVNRRNQKPFTDMDDVRATLNLSGTLDEDYFTFLPVDKVRWRIFSAGNRKLSTIAVLFTPMSVISPWEVDYRYQSERHFDIAEPAGSLATEDF